jgi:DNA-binding IclR family transcriptional regulator
MEIGLTMEAGLEIGSIARPFLEELVRCRPETAHLVIRDGDQVVYIDKISGTKTRSVGIVSYVGKRNPLHCTGVGKCILAYSSDDLIERILTGTLDRYTNNTITDPAELRLELEDIRKRGYSLDREEIEIGLKCVAAPIFGLRSQLIGAISLSCPSSIMPDEEMLKMIPSVIETARLISDQLGFKEKL